MGRRLDGTLGPDYRVEPVANVVVDGLELGDGFDRVCLESSERFDIEVLGHRWTDVSGPITVEMSDGHNRHTWVTVRDGQAVALAASPPSSSTLGITLRGSATIVVDDERHRLDDHVHVVVAFTTRSRATLSER